MRRLPTRYSSTSVDTGRQRTAISRARLPRLDRPVVGVEPERLGPARVALSSSAAGHRGASRRISAARRTGSGPRSPGCRCRGDPERRTRRSARSAARRRRPRLLARTGDDRRAAPRGSQIVVVELHAVNGEQPRDRAPGDRDTPPGRTRRCPRIVPDASSSSSRATRRCRARGTRSPRRLAEMDAQRRPAILRGDRAKQRRRHRIRRVRRDAGAQPRRSAVAGRAAAACRRQRGRIGRRETDQLVEDTPASRSRRAARRSRACC